MNKFLNTEDTVYNQIKSSNLTVGEVAELANVCGKSLYRWSQKDPKSITQLKHIAGVVNCADNLAKIGVTITIKDNIVTLSNGITFEKSDKPINLQIKELAKAELEIENSKKKIDLLVKIIKGCR